VATGYDGHKSVRPLATTKTDVFSRTRPNLRRVYMSIVSPGALGQLGQALEKWDYEPDEVERLKRMLGDFKNVLRGEADIVIRPITDLVAKTAAILSARFKKQISVDPLPAAFTPENLANWARFNLKPVFLPGEQITKKADLSDWVKLNDWFYDPITAIKIAADSATLRRGWYLADFTKGTDYTEGSQSLKRDSLAALIKKLRKAGRVGKYDNTPMGSRFAITNTEWREVVCPAIAEHFGFKPEQVRLERAVEYNAIGNLYDENRGKFNMWEWFDDAFGGGSRLCGGHRGSGGLALVCYDGVDDPVSSAVGRPLVCFA